MYCGNNAKHPELLNRTKILGSRYDCLNKGKNIGYSQPFDPTFLLPYEPIDKTKKYCGNLRALPEGYDRFGGLYECYIKGLGIGKKLKANHSNSNQSFNSSNDFNESKSYSNHSNSNQSFNSSNDFNESKYNHTNSSNESYSNHNDSNNIQKNMYDIEKLFGRNINKKENSYLIGIIIYFLGFSLFFIGMYYGKPFFIIKEDNSETKKIDWAKFIPYLLSFSIIYGMMVYFLMKYLIIE